MGLCHWDNGKVPLAAKRKRGATRETLSALQRQPNELQAGGITEYCNDDDHASYAEPFSQIQPLNEQIQPLNELEMIVEEPLVSLPVIDEPPIKLQKKRGRKPKPVSSEESPLIPTEELRCSKRIRI